MSRADKVTSPCEKINFFESGPVLLYSIDISDPENPKGRFGTPNIVEYLGYSPEEIVEGRVTLQQMLHPEDYEILRLRTKLLYENSEIKQLSMNYRLITRDGELRYMRAFSTIERDDEGMPRYFHGYLMDIHEQEYYKKQLENVIEGARLGYWVWDLQTGYHEVNEHWMNMLGLQRDDLEKRIEDWRSRVHPDDLPRVQKLVETAIEKKTLFSAEFRMRHKDGHWVWILSSGGVVEYAHDSGEPLLMSGTHQDIQTRKRSEEKINYMAFHDTLTTLPNRTLLFDRIDHAFAHAARTDTYNALLFIDLDNFKHINDSLGHKAGDIMLKAIASRLKESVREEDTVARFGGDEFVVLLTDLQKEKAAEYALLVADKIVRVIREPIEIKDLTLHTDASVGITIFSKGGNEGEWDASEVLKRADTAMYHAKGEGKGRIRFFDEKLDEKAQKRLQMDTGMRKALEEERFAVCYQPIVDMVTGRHTGAEALVRWEEDGTMHQPSDFIPIAEESSLILQISRFVIQKVCWDIKEGRLQRSFPDIGSVSINLSANLFRLPDFETKIVSLIKECGIEPSLLTFELTENVLVHDFDIIIEKIHFFKRHGIRFSIDDFGTGYASLTYLKRLPIDIVKIDRSFIRGVHQDADNAKIVETIIDLSRHFGFDIVAEGVEHPEEAKYLRKLGCCYVQGFHFAQPMHLQKEIGDGPL